MFSYSELIAERNLEKGLEIGLEIGKEKGKEREHKEILNALLLAKQMYKDGLSIKEIAKNSILSEDELKDILL